MMDASANPFVQPAVWTPPLVPDDPAPIDLFADAQAAIAARQRTTRRQRAQERFTERERAASQAWLAERAGARSEGLPGWTLAADGSCPVLGPVARWLRERGQGVAVPLAARDQAGFVERLDALVRLADDLAKRAQAAADAATADYAALDARAVRCLALAVEIRQAIWRASLETDQARLLSVAGALAELAIVALETFCAAR
ncbi:hypothetical protein [Burkholderia thailandensis]|uniref:hypothetical protein n=2 Tax=Burkholderia thailandensis TaxID=57975 RepID=UPI001185D4C9|nr:hypothetical protein [Burkholderia thailandensis]